MQGKFQFAPLDGAHYAKILPTLKQTAGKGNAKYNGRINICHTLSARKWITRTNRTKTIIIFIFT
jgi:hypothetical protein